jgi:hypothetical protein
MAAQLNDVRQLMTEARRELHQKVNVLATGVGYKFSRGKQTDQLALVCSVDTKKAKKNLSAKEMIPSEIQGIPTDVNPTGVIHALAAPTEKFRPAPGGVSIGHINITAGTFGCLVRKNNKKFILSNNHVLANSNDAEIGDVIVQPGPTDGGDYPADQIARLSEFIRIDFGEEDSSCSIGNSAASILNFFAGIAGSSTRLKAKKMAAAENLVDCAIAEPLNENDVSSEITDIGSISGIDEGELNMAVKKSGRTTAVIQQIDATVQINYGANKTATFVDQLLTGYMSAGGDSGSAVLNNDNKIVGLLFAGSSNTTIINRIQNVFNALNVTYV